jgi:hypothetical protein
MLDKPTVVIQPAEPKAYFLAGKHYSLECKAYGYPLPTIQWYFKQEGNHSTSSATAAAGCETSDMTMFKVK